MKTLGDISANGKRVFVRVDFNVPFDSEGDISDSTRIEAALPTIKYLQEQGAKVILASHLGRPKGERNPQFSLKPVAAELARKLGLPVIFLEDCIGPEVESAVREILDGSVVLLDNLRFHQGEEKNDPEFSKALAKLAEIFVNDAFGAAHRAHASTAGLPALMREKAAGYLLEKELAYLGQKTANPKRPFVVILGGAKVSDKIGVIDALLEKADSILIGGAMAYTFQLAGGFDVGLSLCESDKTDIAAKILNSAKKKGVRFLLPVDHLIAEKLDFKSASTGETRVVEGSFPDGWSGIDIGPKTIELYRNEAAHAATVLWNGPMGIFEMEPCRKGTFAVAEAIAANTEAISIVGGGDSVKAIKMGGFEDGITFISTGGGASLEFLEGKTLPGVAALEDNL